MIARVVFTSIIIGLCAPATAFARDSARYVCSAVADYGPGGADSKIGVSIDFFRVPRMEPGANMFSPQSTRGNSFRARSSMIRETARVASL